jgi:hypothetical protein
MPGAANKTGCSNRHTEKGDGGRIPYESDSQRHTGDSLETELCRLVEAIRLYQTSLSHQILIRSYAPALAAAFENGFWDLLAWKRSPKVSVLNPNPLSAAC